MRNRLLTLLLLFAAAFGSVVAPDSTHAETLAIEHGIDTHDHADTNDGGQLQQEGVPCHTVSHHHCSIAMQSEAPRVDPKALIADSMTRPAATSPLLSRSQAPPLDPPIA